MSVTALVINYNAGDLLGACVQSLFDNGVHDVRVVDNASTDGSFERLRGRYGRHADLELLANQQNLGFGPAINAALRTIKNPCLLIINPDCRLEKGALDLLRAALEADPDAALAGPAVFDALGRPEAAACRHFPTPWRSLMTFSGLARLARRIPAFEGVTDTRPLTGAAPMAAESGSRLPFGTWQVDATSGACMLLRTEVLQGLGGFDEGYRLHCEDLDLMFRMHQRGHAVLYVPAARAVHVQGVSSASRPVWVHGQKHRGMARFFNQHLAAGYGWPLRWLVRAGIALRWAVLWPWVALKRVLRK